MNRFSVITMSILWRLLVFCYVRLIISIDIERAGQMILSLAYVIRFAFLWLLVIF